MSTVTRRRIGGQSSNSDDDNNSNTNTDSTQHSPMAEKKVAYDPRDVDESKSTPKLTLMEEVLLLGLKDKQVINTLGYFSRLTKETRVFNHIFVTIFDIDRDISHSGMIVSVMLYVVVL
jgi:hypothetical protein